MNKKKCEYYENNFVLDFPIRSMSISFDNDTCILIYFYKDY